MSNDYTRGCRTAFALMSAAQKEVLQQLVMRGPVWDGDVASKAARDDLIEAGLASRACFNGEEGYTVANYRGSNVLRAGLGDRMYDEYRLKSSRAAADWAKTIARGSVTDP